MKMVNTWLKVALFLNAIVTYCTCSNFAANYNVAFVHITQYGELIDSVAVKSILHCSLKCSRLGACKAFIYSREASTCNMNKLVAASTDMLRCTGEGCSTNGGVKYAFKLTEEDSGVLGKACFATADCGGHVGPACVQNVCACGTGFTLSSDGSACEKPVASTVTTTVKPTTVKPTTVTSSLTTTVKPTTVTSSVTTTVKPTTVKPITTTVTPTTVKPITVKPTTVKPVTTTVTPTTVKPTTVKPVVTTVKSSWNWSPCSDDDDSCDD